MQKIKCCKAREISECSRSRLAVTILTKYNRNISSTFPLPPPAAKIEHGIGIFSGDICLVVDVLSTLYMEYLHRLCSDFELDLCFDGDVGDSGDIIRLPVSDRP